MKMNESAQHESMTTVTQEQSPIINVNLGGMAWVWLAAGMVVLVAIAAGVAYNAGASSAAERNTTLLLDKEKYLRDEVRSLRLEVENATRYRRGMRSEDHPLPSETSSCNGGDPSEPPENCRSRQSGTLRLERSDDAGGGTG